MKIVTINLFTSLFDDGGVLPEFITAVRYKSTGELAYQAPENGMVSKSKNIPVYSLVLVPDYMSLSANHLFKTKCLTQDNLGYASRLEGFDSAEAYVRSVFGKNAGQILKRQKRLESCLNISYEVNYGNMSRDRYEFLMATLKAMLVRRFNQRNDENSALNSWDELNATVFDLVNSKKASFFVILNNNVPIQISLQYHFDKVLHSAIPGYDIDYQKFALGNLAIYNQIAWCIDNGYKFFDQGYGDLEYKRRWSNHLYHFKHEIYYNGQSATSVIMANVQYYKNRFKEYLKSKKINVIVEKLKTKVFKQDDGNVEFNGFREYEIEDALAMDAYGALQKIDFHKDADFKKIVNDFLYSNVEHLDAVSVFKILKENDAYLIKGKNKTQKVRLKAAE